MKIDLITLLTIISAVNIIQAVVFIIQYRINKNYNGIGWWTAGFIMVASGLLVSFLRKIPELENIVIILSNIILLLAIIFIYTGCMRFFDKKENKVLILIIFIIYIISLSYFTYINKNVNIRAFIIAISISYFSLLTANCIRANRFPAISATAIFNSAIFYVHSLYFLLRGTSIFSFPDNQNYFLPNNFLILIYIFQLIIGVAWTFGLIIMVNQRLGADLTMLLKETHHRIKNNMNFVINLLSMEAAIRKNTESQEILNNASSRIMSMMTLYEYLYKNEIKEMINAKSYIKDLITALKNIHDNNTNLKIEYQIDEIQLKPVTISSIGLIINELFTNSIKYAYNEKDECILRIKLTLLKDNIHLIFADNGNEIYNTDFFNNSNSFGINLVKMLVKKLHGTINTEIDNGLKYTIIFK